MYAEVAINVPVEGTFHYHVPPSLDGKIRSGHLVRVAFGTAMQPGIVLALHGDSPVEQTKPIIERIDPEPVVSADQIDLARWLSRVYLTPLGVCLWLLLPPGIAGSRDQLATLLNPNALSTDSLQQQIIDLLKRRGPLRFKQIQVSIGGKAWRGALDALVQAGLVETESTLSPPTVRPQRVQTVALAIPPAKIPAVARYLGRKSKRADLLDVIARRPDEPMIVDDVLRIAGVGQTVLKRLAEAGIVRIEKTGRGESNLVFLEIPPEAVDEVMVDLRKGYHDLAVLVALAESPEPLEVRRIYADTGAQWSTLKRLAEAGLITLGEENLWRDSLVERDFVPTESPRLTPEQQAVWAAIVDVLDPLRQPEAATSPVDGGGLVPADAAGNKETSGWTESKLDDRVGDAKDVTPSPSTGRVGEEWKRGWSQFQRWRSPPHLWRKLKPLAQEKRQESTQAETRLWQRLRRKQLQGYKFRRQHSIERFIVDFFCSESRLVVEVDGPIHQYTAQEDIIRREFLESQGLKVQRFTNEEVMESLDAVVERIGEALQASRSSSTIIGEGQGTVFLLHGVTGSGKTEIYLRAIEQALAQGRQAIFLVPEIALTAQTVRRVAARFPGQVGIVHGYLSPGERYDTWRRARQGLIPVVVGARSALFTPLPDVGVIILDEEHDHSYKQSPPFNDPHYHARQVAEEMVRRNRGVLILGSATPDVETYYRAQRGDIHYLHLPNRIMGHRTRIREQSKRAGVTARYREEAADAMTIALPPVELVDMRDELKAGNRSIFSRSLHEELGKVLERREQAILFLNRRGQSTYVFCRDCGYVAACPRCDMPLTYHRYGEALRCHHCGFQQPTPKICPECGSNRIKFFGAGTQQVETELKKQFPQARIVRWDADTASKPRMHEAILQRFIDGEVDVMVGTQMIAKGLDLPLVTLVGVISADPGLALPDFRAGERIFQLLTQVAGRAGRGLLGGQVVLQTYQPDHYAVVSASKHDYERFYTREIAYRRDLGYPPFRRMARIVFRFNTPAKAQQEAERATTLVRDRIARMRLTGTELIGPAPCFFQKIDKVYRWHLLLRGPNPTVALQGIPIARGWHLDLDPVDVL